MRKTKKPSIFKTILTYIYVVIVMLLIIVVLGEIAFRLVITFKGEPNVVDMHIFQESDIYTWEHIPKKIDFSNDLIKSINSHGFRDENNTVEKPGKTKRILALGDSFTFGIKAEQEWLFTEQLEDMLNAKDGDSIYEVINAGTIGYTTDNEYLLLKNKGLQFDPDMVIVFFFIGNDITEFRRHVWVKNKLNNLEAIIDKDHYVDDEGRLRSKEYGEPTFKFLHFVNKRWIILQKKLGLYKDPKGGPTLTWPTFLEPDDPNGDPDLPLYWEKVEKSLVLIRDLLDREGIEFKVVAIPMDVQTNKKYWGKYAEMYFDDDAYEKARPQTKLKEVTNKLGIDLIDLLPYFKGVPDHVWLYFEKDDPHFTADGHKYTAEYVFNNISKKEQDRVESLILS